MFMKALNNEIQEENKRNEAEMAKYDVQSTVKGAQNIMKNPGAMAPKMPSMSGNMSLPSMKLPK